MEKTLEFEHRLTATEDREKQNTRRIEALEKLAEIIHENSMTMVRLVEQIKVTNESVQKLEMKVDNIEKEPLNNYKHLKKTVWTSVITGIVGAIVSAVICLI